MQLMVITRPDFFKGEAMAIYQLMRAGLTCLHIRKPDSTEEQVKKLLKSIPGQYHDRIVLHEHYGLATKMNLKGIHVTGHTEEYVLNRRFDSHPKFEVSASVHSLEELEKRYAHYCYVFLSPIFDSTSKEGYKSAFTPDQLFQSHNQLVLDGSVIALGGVTADRVASLRSQGFGGVAVLGDVWNYFGKEEFIPHFLDLLKAVNTPPAVLTIAGSDCSGGAGIQADIKTISSLGAYAASVVTAVTAQNTLGVQESWPMEAEAVRQQLKSVLDDLPIGAIKIGMVPNAAVAQAIAEVLESRPDLPVVCDPVMVSTSGRTLMDSKALQVMKKKIFPRCMLITPNLPEASLLSGKSITDLAGMQKVAMALAKKYKTRVLLKGGHLDTKDKEPIHDVYAKAAWNEKIPAAKVQSSNLHGTGCTLSSAIATYLAQGKPVYLAVRYAKSYVTETIKAGRNLRLGHGNGPLWHFFKENDKDIDKKNINFATEKPVTMIEI